MFKKFLNKLLLPKELRDLEGQVSLDAVSNVMEKLFSQLNESERAQFIEHAQSKNITAILSIIQSKGIDLKSLYESSLKENNN